MPDLDICTLDGVATDQLTPCEVRPLQPHSISVRVRHVTTGGVTRVRSGLQLFSVVYSGSGAWARYGHPELQILSSVENNSIASKHT